MKPINRLLALCAVGIALPLVASGQEVRPMDNITVTGEKSRSEMRKDVFEAEESFYSLYNQLNDEDEYEVRCFYETPTGTRIKNHVCRAKFVSDAYSRRAARGRGDNTRIANQSADSEFQAKSQHFQQKLETLIAENPDLAEALVRYNTARAIFMQEYDESANN